LLVLSAAVEAVQERLLEEMEPPLVEEPPIQGALVGTTMFQEAPVSPVAVAAVVLAAVF
jgi:hypothetical protein